MLINMIGYPLIIWVINQLLKVVILKILKCLESILLVLLDILHVHILQYIKLENFITIKFNKVFHTIQFSSKEKQLILNINNILLKVLKSYSKLRVEVLNILQKKCYKIQKNKIPLLNKQRHLNIIMMGKDIKNK